MDEQEVLKIVVFRLGNCEFGVPLEKVQEIFRTVPITTLPHAPEYVAGFLELGRSVIAVIDTRKRLNLTLPDQAVMKWILVLQLQFSGRSIGIAVDAVSEIIWIPRSHIHPPGSNSRRVDTRFLAGVGMLGKRQMYILNPDLLLETNTSYH
ncbi:MAG: chemotaxis protein CheW [Bacillota bacterium]